jgi:hydroxyacylglutathione hydrolase
MSVRPQLEDELGDVLEKALRNAGMSAEDLARVTGIDHQRILDAEDYRYDLSCVELQRIAAALGLNEVGVCALGENRYPLPRLPALSFPLHVLSFPYGIGRVNCFVATGTEALVVDTGNDPDALNARWPEGAVPGVVFITHWDREHARGIDALLLRNPGARIVAPSAGPLTRRVETPVEGGTIDAAGFTVRVLRTPGHTALHNAYHLLPPPGAAGPGVLFSGDLVFAGSLGGALHCCRTLLREARRVLEAVPPDTIVAPGHGPLTTAETELRFNPFLP